MNLFEIAIPQVTRSIGQVRTWLDKAQAHAEQKKFDPQVLLTARLAPDQWHLARQIQGIAGTPFFFAALLRGAEPPRPSELEPTLDAVRTRLDDALTHVRGLKPEDFQGAEERVIPMPFAPSKGMRAPAFVTQFALPNFYFHVTTAYAILRHNGVELGKGDYLGPIEILDL